MTTTANLGVTLLEPGQANAHVTVNEALSAMDKAIAGRLELALTGAALALTGAQSTNAILHIVSTAVACTLTVQDKPKQWSVINDGDADVTITVDGQTPTPPTVEAGRAAIVACDGAAVRRITADEAL